MRPTSCPATSWPGDRASYLLIGALLSRFGFRPACRLRGRLRSGWAAIRPSHNQPWLHRQMGRCRCAGRYIPPQPPGTARLKGSQVYWTSFLWAAQMKHHAGRYHLADGLTIIENAAKEPQYRGPGQPSSSSMGASQHIMGAGHRRDQGPGRWTVLAGGTYSIIRPDRGGHLMAAFGPPPADQSPASTIYPQHLNVSHRQASAKWAVSVVGGRRRTWWSPRARSHRANGQKPCPIPAFPHRYAAPNRRFCVWAQGTSVLTEGRLGQPHTRYVDEFARPPGCADQVTARWPLSKVYRSAALGWLSGPGRPTCGAGAALVIGGLAEPRVH